MESNYDWRLKLIERDTARQLGAEATVLPTDAAPMLYTGTGSEASNADVFDEAALRYARLSAPSGPVAGAAAQDVRVAAQSYTVAKAAAIMALPVQTVRKLIRAGKLVATNHGAGARKVYTVAADDIEKYLKDHPAVPAVPEPNPRSRKNVHHSRPDPDAKNGPVKGRRG